MKFSLLLLLLLFSFTNQIFCISLHLPTIQLYPKVALTRDQENNRKVQQIFEKEGITCFNLPCLEFSPGKDKITKENLKNINTIVITSSQGAKNLIRSWEDYQKPFIKIASIGSATTTILNDYGLNPVFQPSIPTAKCFGTELPLNCGKNILYPTSNLADRILENILTSRGFNVTRLNVYETNAPNWTNEMYDNANNVDLVTFFSPSAVNIWANRVGTNYTAIVIGPTTKEAAIKRGFQQVYSSDSIEIESLLDIIQKVSLYKTKKNK